MCININISYFYHKKYRLSYVFLFIITSIFFVLIIMNPFNYISNSITIKIVLCLTSFCVSACCAKCLCIIIDDQMEKTLEIQYFKNYKQITNLSTFIFDYSKDELPTTYGLNNS